MNDIARHPARAGGGDRRAAQRARTQRRYRSEALFRGLGLASVLIAAGFLVFLLSTIVAQGWTSFRSAEIRLAVTFDAAAMDIDPAAVRDDPALLVRADYPEIVGIAAERAGIPATLVSEGAWLRLRDMLAADPALIGQTREVWLTASSAIDQLAKGRVDLAQPDEFRAVSDAEAALFRQLEAERRVRTGWNRLFLTGADSVDPERAGVWGALKGSLLTVIVTLVLAFPLGVLAAIYLEEFAPRNRWTDAIEVSINNLAAVPSIIFGLLGLAVFLNTMQLPRSAPVVGGLTLALMTLPVIVIATRASMKAVPPSIRDAALGVGASRMQVVFGHVLPLALPGVFTGTIIGTSRALGETAPLLMIGMRAFLTSEPAGFTSPATALPVQIFIWSDNVARGFIEKTSGAIIVLLLFLLAMNSLAIFLRNRFEVRW